MKSLKIVDSKELEKFGVEVHYLKMACATCRSKGRKSEWGITVINGEIDPKTLVCRECAAEEKVLKVY